MNCSSSPFRYFYVYGLWSEKHSNDPLTIHLLKRPVGWVDGACVDSSVREEMKCPAHVIFLNCRSSCWDFILVNFVFVMNALLVHIKKYSTYIQQIGRKNGDSCPAKWVMYNRVEKSFFVLLKKARRSHVSVRNS